MNIPSVLNLLRAVPTRTWGIHNVDSYNKQNRWKMWKYLSWLQILDPVTSSVLITSPFVFICAAWYYICKIINPKFLSKISSTLSSKLLMFFWAAAFKQLESCLYYFLLLLNSWSVQSLNFVLYCFEKLYEFNFLKSCNSTNLVELLSMPSCHVYGDETSNSMTLENFRIMLN
jgi:hypothetical protein